MTLQEKYTPEEIEELKPVFLIGQCFEEELYTRCIKSQNHFRKINNNIYRKTNQDKEYLKKRIYDYCYFEMWKTYSHLIKKL